MNNEIIEIIAIIASGKGEGGACFVAVRNRLAGHQGAALGSHGAASAPQADQKAVMTRLA
jgi:hypothetical protein